MNFSPFLDNVCLTLTSDDWLIFIDLFVYLFIYYWFIDWLIDWLTDWLMMCVKVNLHLYICSCATAICCLFALYSGLHYSWGRYVNAVSILVSQKSYIVSWTRTFSAGMCFFIYVYIFGICRYKFGNFDVYSFISDSIFCGRECEVILLLVHRTDGKRQIWRKIFSWMDLLLLEVVVISVQEGILFAF